MEAPKENTSYVDLCTLPRSALQCRASTWVDDLSKELFSSQVLTMSRRNRSRSPRRRYSMSYILIDAHHTLLIRYDSEEGRRRHEEHDRRYRREDRLQHRPTKSKENGEK